jgi:hypothetical protein
MNAPQPLLLRITEAAGPDRELDALIEVAARWELAAKAGLAPQHRARWQAGSLGQVYDGNTGYDAAPVTASVDAALALVARLLPGWSWTGGHIARDDGKGGHWAVLYSLIERGQASGDGMFKSAPLALLAALLEALEGPSARPIGGPA